jgi:chromosome segregation and condensation protein ScpB
MLYKPTFDTLSYMGITSIDQLPNYEQTIASLTDVINQNENNV